jgi:hypothetical protein
MRNSLIFFWLTGILFLAGCASEMGRGSSQSVYSIASVLTVFRDDIGKDVQLKLDQNLLFDFDKDPVRSGEWSLDEYDPRTLTLLSETPQLPDGDWGVLLRGKAIGSGWVKFKFTPYDEEKPPEEVKFYITIKK